MIDVESGSISKMEGIPFARPQTPQALLHRAPDKPNTTDDASSGPKKYIILLLAPTSVAGKVQIAKLVSKSLSCPLFQGDSLHESSAKAATVGASRSDDGGRGRYQRMWLSKMTRTGLLFPEESRPANEGFSGYGGTSSSSTSTSRRGSVSSISSTNSFSGGYATGSTIDVGNQSTGSGSAFPTQQHINQPVFTVSEEERRRKLNPALMVLTHPELEVWHKNAIREATGEYGIGIIFVPLHKTGTDASEDREEEEVELPVLRPLDPSTIAGFTSFDALRAAGAGLNAGRRLKYGKGKKGSLREEMLLDINVDGNVEDITEEVINAVNDVMSA